MQPGRLGDGAHACMLAQARNARAKSELQMALQLADGAAAGRSIWIHVPSAGQRLALTCLLQSCL
eukprot:223134-Chlamydomonas_euryale.AAC.4